MGEDSIQILQWVGIGLCVAQSAMFSGLNLALFGISRLELEIEVAGGNPRAKRILGMRMDANFLLCSILWGNVSVNVLLALITDSVLSGVAGFLFSTFAITLFGEIVPQAFFSRNAMRIGSLLAPVMRCYQVLLFPVAKPCAMVLDLVLGPEGTQYYRETHLKELISQHMQAEEADLEHQEGMGALNFLALDDLCVADEGEPVDPRSVLKFPLRVDLPVLPETCEGAEDPFVQAVQVSGRKWVVLTGEEDDIPHLVLDADGFLRDVMFARGNAVDPYAFCSRPLVVDDPAMALGACLRRLRVDSEHPDDDVIDQDLILLWNAEQRRIITGADILGRLLRGIARDLQFPAPEIADKHPSAKS